jgi:acetylornithine/N-succinyldiaminopimelate aminotransferase
MTSQYLLPVHNRLNIAFSYGKGCYLFDKQDKRYLDFGAGIAVNSLGHCHPALVDAIKKQSEKLWHVSNIYEIDELEQFAEKLVTHTFADYAFLCNSGAEAVECGIKMVRKHFYELKEPNRNRIITFTGAFHGRTIATISAAGKQKYIEGFEPKLEGFDNVEFGNIEAVKKAITKNTAGILIEPIQGEEGIRASSKEFIKELRKLADENGLLLFFDEVQCGAGRTGYLYAYEYYNVKPDIIASAKGIGGGFPIGVCLATKEAASGMKIGSHGTTYGGNPLAMAVGKAVLDVMLADEFLDNVKNNGAILKNELQNLVKEFPTIAVEVRGIGLMLGLKIAEKFLNTDIVNQLKDHGLLVVAAGENVLRIVPPLIVTKKEIDEAIAIFKKVFSKL